MKIAPNLITSISCHGTLGRPITPGRKLAVILIMALGTFAQGQWKSVARNSRTAKSSLWPLFWQLHLQANAQLPGPYKSICGGPLGLPLHARACPVRTTRRFVVEINQG